MTTLRTDRLTSRPSAHTAPPRLTRVRPAAVFAVIVAGAVATVGLWWQNTLTIAGLGDWLTNAGRITGLLAGYAMVVLLALMARIPALERGVGTDRLARWHAMGGRYAVWLIVSHGLLIIWGYAVTAHTDVVTQTGTLVMSYPDVLMATVAGLLMVGVGIVSARAARRRMRYETWHYLHFYTYLAVALAFAHQFATGAEFVDNLAARVWWSAMYVIVAVLLIWYRFLAPVRATLRHRLRVANIRREAPGVVSVYVTGSRLHELRAEPGQFFRWRFLTRDLWWTANPYSLSAPVNNRFLRITVKDLGEHSRSLARLRRGTRVVAEGPYGAFTAHRRTRRKVLLLGGGVGITPLRTLFETLPADPGDLTLIYRSSHPVDIVFRRELDAIAADRAARVHYVIGQRSALRHDPLGAARLLALVPDLREHDVYLCGPTGMTEAVLAALRSAGVRRRHIHDESFAF